MKLEFFRKILGKKAQVSSFIKIRPVGAKLCHAETIGHGKADNA
jgi:hypothetical protein